MVRAGAPFYNALYRINTFCYHLHLVGSYSMLLRLEYEAPTMILPEGYSHQVDHTAMIIVELVYLTEFNNHNCQFST